MAHYRLALSGLSCHHCVAKLKKQLNQQQDQEIIYIDKHYLKLQTPNTLAFTIAQISEAGYHAESAITPDVVLNLTNLKCAHCLKKIETALNTLPNVADFELSLDQLKIYGHNLDTTQIIQLIQDNGFEASLAVTPRLTAATSQPKEFTQTTISHASEPASLDLPIIKLHIDNMSCASCIAKIEKKLHSLDGVHHVSANLAQQLVNVQTNLPTQQLQTALADIGYHSTVSNTRTDEIQQQSEQKKYTKFRNGALIALISSFLMMFWAMQGNNDQLTLQNQSVWLTIGVVSLLLIVVTGRHFFINSWRNLLHRQTTMDSLVALSAGTAWLYSAAISLFPLFFPATARHLYYESALMIIGFINLGHAIEIKGKQRSSQALQHLLHLTPPTARLVQGELESFIPLEQVVAGMVLRANTGERIAVDGTIIQGEAWLNESMLTGEPLAQYKQQADSLFAGTLVENGSIFYQAEAIGTQTKLAQIIQIVEQAQSSKPKIAKLVDRIASVFVPLVLFIALISAGCWFLIGPAPQLNYALIIFTTVLIIACPCALGLATPMSIIASVARAAQLGILVKDASALEQASKVSTVVFDKTGTLTKGKPEVSYVEYLTTEWNATTTLNIVTQLEKTTHHPLAQAILDYSAQQQPIEQLISLTQIITHKGFGVSGELNGKKVLLGNERLMQQRAINTTILSDKLIRQREAGATLVYLAIEQQLVAVFAIMDQIRSEAITALSQLQQQGYELVMLTGDHEITANYLAKKLNITRVIAHLLPEDKAQIIQQLQQQAQTKVAMIGDGINDAPALAQADVSIAMGQGSHIAIETAHIILMTDNLNKVNDALALAKQSARNIKQNLMGAFIYNLVCIPIAAGILYPIWGILLNPMWGSLAMALSSVTVIANANRLLRFKP